MLFRERERLEDCGFLERGEASRLELLQREGRPNGCGFLDEGKACRLGLF